MDQLVTPTRQLQPYLGRIRWRLRLRDGLLLAQNTFWVATAVAMLVLLAGRVFPIEQPWRWALLPIGIWLIGVIAYTLFRPLPTMQVARRTDAELHLKERLSTSLALDAARESPIYASFQPELVEKEHADALRTARAIDPSQAFPLLLQRKMLSYAGGLLLAGALLIWLPNPMDAIIAERKEVAKEAQRQAEQIEKLREEVKQAEEMSPEERDALLRKLDELARQLRENKGDRDQALANLSKLEEELRQQMNPKASQRQAALEAMAAQMQAMAKEKNPQIGDLDAAAKALEKLAEEMQKMSQEEREAMAQQLSQMAARAAQAGDSSLAQALSAMSQAMMNGDQQSAQQAASDAAKAMENAKSEMAKQGELSKTMSQLQQSRRSIASAGQSSQRAQGQSGKSGQGQGQGQGQGKGDGKSDGQSQGQGQGQGQGKGNQAGGGGGTTANSLPPANRTGKAGKPQGSGKDTGVGSVGNQVYVPREKLNASTGNEVFIPGQDTDQGESQTKEQRDPTSGVSNPALVPYDAVFQSYMDAAGQAMDQSYIPPSMRDYIREYFSQLEPQ